ncbi:MAG TPA: NACHT domain-containing protein [Pyrinomonadaceae bacterium]|jgi:hypothetical protein|nr:NACHT domain-containing protein [Pyrinomonadaceae bacterium]
MPPDPLTITAAGAWAWDKYGKSLTDKAIDAAKGSWKKFKWTKASADYRAKIKKLYGTMQIMGMAGPVPLDDIFTEAYLLDKPTAFSRFDIERLKQASADPNALPPNAKRVTGLTLVKRNKNLFILGKPGAGKTTFLKYIAIQAAEPEKPIIDKVPIFISLKQWADSGVKLMSFIEDRFDICDFPDACPFVKELLKSGGAIVLFDGLDEVNQEGGLRDKQTREMNSFIEKYDRAQCLITCRLAASDYSFKPFTYVEVADFTEKQIETFVGNWFRNQEGEKDEETSKRFLMEFRKEENKGLRDLARTPLLLTLLCLSFNETLTFPQRRVEIYKEAVDALLKKWDTSRRIKRDEVYRKLSLGHKENMLARIAAETFEKNQYFIPQHELEKLITDYVRNVPPHDAGESASGETILKSIEAQQGIFVERAREVYSFSHLTFQEYFAAKYIVDNASKGTLSALIKEHCADSRWREVFLLTTSLLPDASAFMTKFRSGIDELLEGDEKLSSLLEWANTKTSSIQGESWLVRSSYLFLEFYINKKHGVASRLRLANTSIDPAYALDVELVAAISGFNQEAYGRRTSYLKHAYDIGLNRFAEYLSSLSLPSGKATDAEWDGYVNELRSLTIKHRDIGHELDLARAQESQFMNYILAIRLLKDCLELAFMPPEEKETILNSLYLPPAYVIEG